MASPFYRCPYCGREDFASSKGLTQHQQQNRLCLNKMRDKFSTDSGYFTAKETLECLPVLDNDFLLKGRSHLRSSSPRNIHQNFTSDKLTTWNSSKSTGLEEYSRCAGKLNKSLLP